MDAQEAFARAQFVAALQQASPAGGADEASQAVIREARANAARERERMIMELPELLAVFHVPTLDALAAIAPVLEAVGCPKFPRAIELDHRGNPHPPTKLMRHDYDRWRANLDTTARALGYALAPARTHQSVPRTIMALVVALVAGLLS